MLEVACGLKNALSTENVHMEQMEWFSVEITKYLNVANAAWISLFYWYRQTSNIKRTWVGNELVDHSYLVGASPISTAPTTSSFSTLQLASINWVKTAARWDKNHWSFWIPWVLF